jgi:F-type H+-transporting ATPase subunit delta
MAQSTAIARRYARAYFDLAGEADAIAEWREQLASAIALVTDPETARRLRNPRLRREDRARGVAQLLDDIAPPARNLVRLLIERGRIAALPEVLDEYDRLADRASGVVRAEVVAAIPVDAQLEDRIKSALTATLGSNVETVVSQDPDIVGGLIIRIGDRVIDSSLRTRLQQLQASLA